MHVQNATLSGGVAVGTAANFLIHPWGAVLIGCIAAAVTTIGFQYIQVCGLYIIMSDVLVYLQLHISPSIIYISE